ncbi:ATPase [Brevundimonas sp. Leaf363]|uniref:ATP-binding protein n=1 Tax=Brevundimonas sp. Leaf363 TaxID=1736353 RepID=UPI0006FD56EC|nr:ATP-binding protein [Brevundimonas sp. Leaf363]KQS55659.1 ATPase [Brevundimonas sp. Leaf363]
MSETAPSPVAPSSLSPLWRAWGVEVIVALVLGVLALVWPERASWFIAAAVTVLALGGVARMRMRPLAEAASATAVEAVVDAPTVLEEALEVMDDPVLIVAGEDPDYLTRRRILFANRAARELMRIPKEGALLLTAVRDPDVLEAVDEALFGGLERVVEFAPGGVQDRRWRARTRPLPDAQGSRALLVLRDETEARRMEQMRVDFLANASHELRTPLASLSGFIETLRGHAKDDPIARDRFLDIMATQADRMARLVADLLSLSRIELNEHIPPSGRTALDRAAADVIDAVSPLSGAKGVEIRLDAPARVTVLGDRDEIIQVVQNLVDNAIKYSPAPGVVEVSVRGGLGPDETAPAAIEGNRLPLLTPDREAGVRYAAVTIRDRGPGMARESLPRLTERFFRVEGQKSGERSGTGLGLAIVKHILNRHRGGLAVESKPGGGTVFTAWLPMADERAKDPPAL